MGIRSDSVEIPDTVESPVARTNARTGRPTSLDFLDRAQDQADT
ncbi:hypothetical protein [Bifidobacterium pseudolongum]|nr:hypothetical protein [Bifidobacterium pseudolongum]